MSNFEHGCVKILKTLRPVRTVAATQRKYYDSKKKKKKKKKKRGVLLEAVWLPRAGVRVRVLCTPCMARHRRAAVRAPFS